MRRALASRAALRAALGIGNEDAAGGGHAQVDAVEGAGGGGRQSVPAAPLRFATDGDSCDEVDASADADAAVGGGTADAASDASGWARVQRLALERAARLDPCLGTARALQRLEECADHADCTRAVAELHALCSSHDALLALGPPERAAKRPAQSEAHLVATEHPLLTAVRSAAADGLLTRLLLTPPATAEDDELLESLLSLLTRALVAHADAAAAATVPTHAVGPLSPLSPPPPPPPPRVLFDSLLGSGAALLERTSDERGRGGSLPRVSLRLTALRFGAALLRAPSAKAIPRLAPALRQSALLAVLAEQYCGREAGLPPAPPPLRRAALDLLAASAAALPPASPLASSSPRSAAPASSHPRSAATLTAERLVTLALTSVRQPRAAGSRAGVSEQRLALRASLALLPSLPAADARSFAGRALLWLCPLLDERDAELRASVLEVATVLGEALGGGRALQALLPGFLSSALATASDATAPFLPRTAALRAIRRLFSECGSVAGAIGGAPKLAAESAAAAAAAAAGEPRVATLAAAAAEAEAAGDTAGAEAAAAAAAAAAAEVAAEAAAAAAAAEAEAASAALAAAVAMGTASGSGENVAVGSIAGVALRALAEDAAAPQLIAEAARLLESLLLRSPLQQWPPASWSQLLRWLSVSHHWAAFLRLQANTLPPPPLPGADAPVRLLVGGGAAALDNSGRGGDGGDGGSCVDPRQAEQWLGGTLPAVEAARSAVLSLLWASASRGGALTSKAV